MSLNISLFATKLDKKFPLTFDTIDIFHSELEELPPYLEHLYRDPYITAKRVAFAVQLASPQVVAVLIENAPEDFQKEVMEQVYELEGHVQLEDVLQVQKGIGARLKQLKKIYK